MNSKTKFLILSLLFFSTFLLHSCMPTTIVDLNQDIGDGWTKDRKVRFDFEVKDTITPVDFYINVRNSTDYDYANIFFFIKTIYPNQRYSVDTVEIFLADIKGKWLGNGLGKYRNTRFIFRKGMRFPMKGMYHMEFEMAMRDKELNGIDALGIRVEEAKQ